MDLTLQNQKVANDMKAQIFKLWKFRAVAMVFLFGALLYLYFL